jgi:hypothetical protein
VASGQRNEFEPGAFQAILVFEIRKDYLLASCALLLAEIV